MGSSLIIVVVVGLAVLVVGELSEQRTRHTLVGSTWQMASYDYLVFDGQNGDHRSDPVTIAHPERYSLVFDADGAAVLTGDCKRSFWAYTVEDGVGDGLLQGTPGVRFELQRYGEVVASCAPAGDLALDVTGGYAADSFVVYLARTWGLEFRSGALVLLRPLEIDPFTGTYPDSRPLEQVFVPTPRQ